MSISHDEFRKIVQSSTSEKDFQKTVQKLATIKGWYWYHASMSMRDNAGFPDLVMVRRDRVVFAELKTEKGRVRKAQSAWLGALKDSGCVEVYLWRPRHIDEITSILS